MSDGIPQQAEGAGPGARGLRGERRSRLERRRRIWWSLLYGSFRPRRRRPSRRLQDVSYRGLDWHGAHLWAVSIGILILSVSDAFLTVVLLSRGAVEANPFMAAIVGRDVTVFAAIKIAITGMSVTLMVFLARYRFMRLVRVDVLLYCIFGVYVLLIWHELGMLRQLTDAHPL